VFNLNHATRFFGVALAVLACCAPAAGQDYPSRPVTLIIPFPAGGGVDTIGRVIAATRPRSGSRSLSRTGPAQVP
jgi:tripartite-type tricarboxylate transporter receptor subunit TctC